MELPGDKQPRLGDCRNNGQLHELDDCDLCVEFALFFLTLITLERKKNKLTKQQSHVLPSFCHRCIPLLVTRKITCSQAAAKIDVFTRLKTERFRR